MSASGKLDPNLGWERCRTDSSLWKCPYADGVYCQDRRCRRCGWEPGVQAGRMAELRETGHVTVRKYPVDDVDGAYLPGLLDEKV